MILLPAILATRDMGDAVQFDLSIQADLDCLRGHFKNMPILPGVVQVQWAAQFAAQRWPAFSIFRGLRKLKFQNPVVPGRQICLQLTPLAAEATLAFQYFDAETSYSSGRILFAPP